MRRNLSDVSFVNKKVICRLDCNVPIEDRHIMDETRIISSLPTLKYLLSQGAIIIILAHLGRPKGRVVDHLRLEPVAKCLSNHLGISIKYVSSLVYSDVKEEVAKLNPGDIIFLENTRFYPGEEKNDKDLAVFWSQLADVHVNDAFGVSHRKHVSNFGLAAYLPSVAGKLLSKEVDTITKMLSNVQKPFVVLLGGAKVDDKIGVFESLLNKADAILVGGGMASAFLAAKGYNMGKSTPLPSVVNLARDIIHQATSLGVELILPIDVVISDVFSSQPSELRRVKCDEVSDHHYVLDIGPRTCELFSKYIKNAKQIIWNGPMGVFEWSLFSKGTEAIARAMAETSAFTLVGGGDSLASLKKTNCLESIDHLSTGGGAMLEMLSERRLPYFDVI